MKELTIFLFWGMMLFNCMAIEIDRTQKPAPEPPPKVSFPDFEEITLSNGLKIFFLKSNRQPTVTFRLVVKSGSAFDADKPGLASFVADQLTKGTVHRSAGQFAQEADFIGASVEAGSSLDAIYVTAWGLTKYTDTVLDLLQDAMLHPTFPDLELEKFRKKVLSQLEAEKKDPDALAHKLEAKLLYGNHPYGQIITEKSAQSISQSDLESFHKNYFIPNNATLIVVGDISKDDILPKVEKVFGNWKAGTIPKLTLAALPEIKGVTIHIVDRPGSVQSTLLVAQPGFPRNNPDMPDINVVFSTLGGGMSGRLFQNLREKHGYTYGASLAPSLARLSGLLTVNTSVRNEVTGAALQEIIGELKKIRVEPIPDFEINMHREYCAGNYLLSLENPSVTASRVQDIDLYGLRLAYYKEYASRIASVTAERAQNLAQQYLDPENLVVTVVGETQQIKPQLKPFGAIFVYDTNLQLLPEQNEIKP